jgi:hypothetical protein
MAAWHCEFEESLSPGPEGRGPLERRYAAPKEALVTRPHFLRVSSGNEHIDPQPRSPKPRAHAGMAHY